MKAILVIDIPDNMLKKHNEKIEDLSISFIINGKVENYYDRRNSHELKPMPEKLDAVEIAMQCGNDEVSDKLVYQVEGYNRCIERILGE